MFSILVMSCDKYKCLSDGFMKCLDKYYPNHPEVHFVYSDGCWSKRFREALKGIKEDYVLVMLDDFFIRKKVNKDLIKDALKTLKSNQNIAVINFEKYYRPCQDLYNNWSKQYNGQIYLNSCQPSLHNKKYLLERLQKDEDAWSWETTKINSSYDFLINKSTTTDIIDVGYNHTLNWGISRGKITDEFKSFLRKEDIDLEWQDYQL